ncbi:MAG: glycerol-3-phosphate 1-O-acyltransferase PlsY [Fusobacteriaceae bacterium]|jgi:glycerol-3-phosphate acyltransferase PlsY|nr:glycerol-3-phosphate 1-O-acyltransferase PlsY [Fusobacteriaceae bacterium]
MKTLLFAIIAYFSGAIPSGVWIGKFFKKIDIREHGSNNTGTTNAYRVLGAKYGIIVLLMDVLKGFFPLFLANYFGVQGTHLIVIGMIAIIGHTFSCFINFNGGKGVATSMGVFLFLIPGITIILVGVFIVIVYFSKYISVGSIVCALLLPILTCFFRIRAGIPRIPLIIIATIIGIFVVYKHRANILRLRDGTENKFKL